MGQAQVIALPPSRGCGPDVQHVALRKLRMLDAATGLADIRVPRANRLKKRKGDRAGQWSIRVNDQWRLCFRWDGADAHHNSLTIIRTRRSN